MISPVGKIRCYSLLICGVGRIKELTSQAVVRILGMLRVETECKAGPSVSSQEMTLITLNGNDDHLCTGVAVVHFKNLYWGAWVARSLKFCLWLRS